MATAAALVVGAGACTDGSAAVGEWCRDLAGSLVAPDDELEARQRRLLEEAPDEVADVLAHALALEDAPPLPEGTTSEEADAIVEAFVEASCRDEVDAAFDSAVDE